MLSVLQKGLAAVGQELPIATDLAQQGRFPVLEHGIDGGHQCVNR